MRYYLMGESLTHSYSVLIHGMLGEYSYEIKNVSKDEFVSFVKNGDWDGLNVTIPYKTVAYELSDKLSDVAKMCRSVNTMVRQKDGSIFGDNTDYYGLSATIKHAGILIEGKVVAVLGSGGTSKTAQAVAKNNGAKEVLVVSRKLCEGSILYEELYKRNDIEVIINTTPVGMTTDYLAQPVDLSKLDKVESVVDVIYNPLRSRLLQQAEGFKMKTAGGLYMLVTQAAKASELFTGRRVDEIHKVYIKTLHQKRNVALIGMPGSGKTVIGKRLAELTGREFIDTDQIIVENTGETIPDIFTRYGEAYFRELESRVIAEYATARNAVISYGGGACQNYVNCVNLKANSVVFYIQRDINHLETVGRPLSKDAETLCKMYKRRHPIFSENADCLIDNNGSIEDAVGRIVEVLHEDTCD